MSSLVKIGSTRLRHSSRTSLRINSMVGLGSNSLTLPSGITSFSIGRTNLDVPMNETILGSFLVHIMLADQIDIHLPIRSSMINDTKNLLEMKAPSHSWVCLRLGNLNSTGMLLLLQTFTMTFRIVPSRTLSRGAVRTVRRARSNAKKLDDRPS